MWYAIPLRQESWKAAGWAMKMPAGYPKDLYKALQDGILTRAHLETCAMRIIGVYQKLNT